jgi:UDP-glucose-4-epimerase GalE
VILDDLSRGHRSFVERLGVPLAQVDLRDEAGLERTLVQGGFDAVLHFAGLALVPESVERPALYAEVNLEGGKKLLRAMRKAGCKRIVVSSTAAVYGQPVVSPISEDAPLVPLNPYGQTKLDFERALAEEEKASGLNWLALRYFNATGASDEGDLGERHDPETHLVPRLLMAARSGQPFRLFGRDHATRDGTCLRDFIHVLDLARAHVLALEKLGSLAERAINLGTGEGTTVLEAVGIAERVLGRKVIVENHPQRPGDPAALVARVDVAARALGFRTERTLEDAIRSQARFFDGH